VSAVPETTVALAPRRAAPHPTSHRRRRGEPRTTPPHAAPTEPATSQEASEGEISLSALLVRLVPSLAHAAAADLDDDEDMTLASIARALSRSARSSLSRQVTPLLLLPVSYPIAASASSRWG
jgi:hypothetical protein